FDGGPNAYRITFALMALATLIDATDGTLARKIRIKEVIPQFDGRKLDDITDFLTYTALPLVVVWRAGLVPAGTEWLLVVPLLASAYGFCQTEAKTDDGYFLGFPSLWNVVAFYLYILQLPGAAALAIILTLAFMTFVPSRYLYPSQPGPINKVANVLGAIWTVMLGYLVWMLPSHGALQSGQVEAGLVSTAQLSVFYPVFYLAVSWFITIQIWRRGQRPAQGAKGDPGGM
ncbi:MAG: CDP-alcohol phosphatidyltransferase family protein, partial [Isosphaeraceae bacterium]